PARLKDAGLETSVQFLKGAGPKKCELLGKLGIRTLRDLLLYFPRHHEDRRLNRPIGRLPTAGKAAVEATVVRASHSRLGKNLLCMNATLRDASGTLEAVWFKRYSYKYDVFMHLKKL